MDEGDLGMGGLAVHTNGNGNDSTMSGGANAFSGIADGPVVQARDVHGDVYVGAARKAPYEPPHQAPPSNRLFQNRVTELADVDGCLNGPGPPAIYVLHGPPGVGKTAVLKQWAAQAAAAGRYPGGEFWIDYRALREQSAGGADVAEALHQCLRATGVAETYLPGTLHELTNAFRDRTSRQSVLLLLDEVSEPAQVRALLPSSPGSAVLVAGRSRLGELVTQDGASAGALGPLDDAHALALLRTLCGAERLEREPDRGAPLVDACAGLPVALQVAAVRLSRSRPGQLATELADERRRLAALSAPPTQGDRTVSAVFTVAYSGLTAEEARLYRLLGLFPGQSFDVGTVVCVAGVDPQTADDLLYELEEAALLEWDEEDGRYGFHDLVRLHARECAMNEESEQERAAVLERCVDYYVTGAAFADLAVMGEERLRIGGEAARRPHAYDPFEGPERRRAALAWLATERTEALAVLRAAAEHGGMEHQVWQLAESLTALYLNHRHLNDWRICCALGAEAAAADGRPDAEARLRALLSRPLLDAGEDARAREELDLALARAEESGNLLLRASVREFDGRYWDRHDHQRAIESYERSLDLNEQVAQNGHAAHSGYGDEGDGAGHGGRPDNARGIALARFFLGCALEAAGHHDRALAELLGAQERFRELEDIRMAGRAVSALGRAHQARGEHEAAGEAYEEAVRLLRESQSTHYEAETLEAWATLDERQSEPEAARERLLRALEIYEAGGSPRAHQLRERLGADEV